MKKVIFSMAVLALLVVTSCKTEVKKDNEPVKEEMADMAVYQCPMDCEKGKTYDKEGNCPVCKMEIKKVEKDAMKNEDHSGHNH